MIIEFNSHVAELVAEFTPVSSDVDDSVVETSVRNRAEVVLPRIIESNFVSAAVDLAVKSVLAQKINR